MTIKGITVLLLLVVLFLSGCTTFDYQSHNKILNYYNSTPKLVDVFWGIGAGNNLDRASENSRLDISKQLYSKVYERIVREQGETDIDGQLTNRESLEVLAELETEATLKNAKRLDYKIAADGTVYVLSYLNTNLELPLDESQVMSILNSSYKKQKNFRLLSSIIIPGSGQIMDRNYREGGIMLGGTFVSTFGLIYGLNGMNTTYQDYLSANNSSTQQYYYSQYEDYRLFTILSGVFYLADSIISGLNYESKSF